MGLIFEDFATWTEKTRRKLLRECGDEGRCAHENLPPGVPVSVPEALEFIDALVRLNAPDDIVERAEKWRDKLCRIRTSRRGLSFRE